MGNAARELISRGQKHDESKLHSPEKPLFDKYTPILHGLTYGSDDYKASLVNLKPALDHHYARNTHHPEHYVNGVNDMNLYDLIEMFFDWKAASERQTNGNICKSITSNCDKYNISSLLHNIFQNSVKHLGW